MEKRFEELIDFMIGNHISDLHIQEENTVRIEGRNLCGFISVRTKENDGRLLPYLQYIAGMDISENAKPQSGSFEYCYREKTYSFRFAYLVSGNTKSGVLRLLDIRDPVPLKILAADERHRAVFENWTHAAQGLILISGPTGAGKTTTAYSIAGNMNGRKVYSLEDPVEIRLNGIVQIQVNPKIGLTYADGIKQLLRHDPDVIMIGEIRDEETAAMAMRSALTGHLVLTTIHAGNAKTAVRRLEDLGISRYDLEDVLIGVTNQRLFHTAEGTAKRSLYEVYEKKNIPSLLRGEVTNVPSLKEEAHYAVLKGWIRDEKEIDLL